MASYNLLYVIWSLGLGGAERVVINSAKAIDKAKFNPMVCCLNDKGPFAVELEREGIEVIALNKQKKIEPSIIWKLAEVITSRDIHIVHTHLWGANFWGRLAAIKAKVPVIIATEHNEDTWKPWFYFLADRWLSKRTDRIVAVSNKVKEFYVSKGISYQKIEVVYNGIDAAQPESSAETLTSLRREFGIKDDEKVVAMIGRLVPQKGHRFFFAALKELLARHKIKGLIVGEGPLMDSLRSSVVSLQLKDEIIFTGLRKDVKDILAITDILAMPSLREGLPMIALEAMVAGVPVVAAKVGGLPELIEDGISGILAEPGNPVALEKGLDRLLGDREFGNKLAVGARERVKKLFSIETMTSKTEKLYSECLSRKE